MNEERHCTIEHFTTVSSLELLYAYGSDRNNKTECTLLLQEIQKCCDISLSRVSGIGGLMLGTVLVILNFGIISHFSNQYFRQYIYLPEFCA